MYVKFLTKAKWQAQLLRKNGPNDSKGKPEQDYCGLIRPDASYSGGGKEGVDFGLLLAVLLSLDGVVPGSVL